MILYMSKKIILMAFCLVSTVPGFLLGVTVRSEKADFIVTPVAEGLNSPWSLAFLPGNEGYLVTERPGNLFHFKDGEKIRISGLPDIAAGGQGGLMDILPDPDFGRNRTVYFSYSERGQGGSGTAVASARLAGDSLERLRVLFRASPKSSGGRHFGSRLLIGEDGLLYITLGDRGVREKAQDLGDHAGTVVRILRDGSIPEDNPFTDRSGALPEIYSYGHRNAQGMALHPQTKEIWLHEHGPRGGDEVNIVKKGANYGWPEITYGIGYSGRTISPDTSKPGMEQPVVYWDPSIAPSGMAFYTGAAFPEWEGNLFVGALAGQHLRRLEIRNGKVRHQEVLLQDEVGRIRDVRLGPDGYLYLLTDQRRGGLYRISPAG